MTTVHELLRDGARRFGGKPAIFFDEESISYEELLVRAENVGRGFTALGVTGADRVAVIMENSVDCILIWLASNMLGCTDVPLNPQYRGELLRYLLTDSDASIIVCDAEFAAQIVEVSAHLPQLRTIVARGGGDRPEALPSRIAYVDYAQCHIAQGSLSTEGASERVILYTSGTTGPSKGVIHTQKSCLVLARYNAQMLAYDIHDRLLNFFPLYHQNARYTGVMPALCAGASIRMQRRFSSSTFWKTCDEDGATAFNYLGSVLRLILNATEPGRVAGAHSVRKAFGAGATPSAWDECERKLGITLVETYGLTEAPMATLNARHMGKTSPIGSAGRASDLFEVAVVDDEDRLAPANTIGEIVMRPRRPDALTIGYNKKDEATVRAFRNLWFHSGDRGRLSPEGDLYFEERGKDSIRRRGENISAWEVESILDQHPAVAESAVYGVPSAEADEDVCAALVLRGKDFDLADLVAFAQERLPRYAVPTLFRIVDDFPRTPTAKVQKAELRAAGRSGCLTPGGTIHSS